MLTYDQARGHGYNEVGQHLDVCQPFSQLFEDYQTNSL